MEADRGMETDANGIIDTGKNKISLRAKIGETVLAVLRGADAAIAAPCGGNGTCGKCRAVVSGLVSPMEESERRFLSKEEIAKGIRLACMCRILGDFEVHLADDFASMKVETGYRMADYTAAPVITVRRTENSASFYQDGRCIDTAGLNAKNFGLAVDIGTTTVAVYLCDMESNTVVAVRGFRNPQASYGADVISRIDKIMKNHDALGEQQRLVIDAISGAAREMCASLGWNMRDIRAAVLCGNTVMQHIAAGIDPSSIANAPFIAPTLFGDWRTASELGLDIFSDAPVYFAPCFASYVGGDIACGMIATGLDACSDNVLFIDIGTNGEIGLSTPQGLYFCSAAAGPAFEGAHIACGMAGITGAVSEIAAADGKIGYRTIGNVPPVGICGSGILDAAAVMLDTGLLDETGCIADADEVDAYADYLSEDEDGNSVFMIDRERNIYINGADIREIQLAKAAISAGILTLLDKAGLKIEEITSAVLAGGFGSHINETSACRIGLIPRALEGKIVSAGNTAGAGAVAILLGAEPREAARTICAKSDYTELSQNAFFMEKYIEEMMFEENADE